MNLPRQVQIEVSTRCNARCRFCVVTNGKVAADMSWETFEQALGFVGPGCTVALFGAGEGLLHPRFLDMVWACKERGAVATVTTNGVPVSKWGAGALRAAGLDRIAFSIAGIGAEHERIQEVDSGEAWRNLGACAAAGIETKLVALLLGRNVLDGTVRVMLEKARAAGADAVTMQEILAHESWSFHAETLRAVPNRAELLAALDGLATHARQLGLVVEKNYDQRPTLGETR